MRSHKIDAREFVSTLGKHRERLLRVAGCTGVALGMRQVRGEITDSLALVIFVERKLAHPRPHAALPKQIDGLPVDVVERSFSFAPIRGWGYYFGQQIDPHVAHDPLLCGVAIAAANPLTCSQYGSLGCFIRTTGKALAVGHPAIPAGAVYLLTNQHVLAFLHGNPNVIQPGFLDNTGRGVAPPANYTIGTYLDGYMDPLNDCAVVTLNTPREWRNHVDCAPGVPGRKALAGVAQAQVNDEVYKFGATSKYTAGIVTNTNFAAPGIQNAIYIENKERHEAVLNNRAPRVDQTEIWVAPGDSGSVLIRSSDDRVVGLNFREDALTTMNNVILNVFGGRDAGSWAGLAYDMQAQMDNFCDPGGQVTLA